jgi:4-hydroxy 2-oxovalerate aldolase
MYKPASDISNNTFELVDVTMRDGALGRRFPYTLSQLKQYLHILESIGIRYAEVGFISGPGKWTEGRIDSPNYDINPKLNQLLQQEFSLTVWSMIDSDNPRIKQEHIHKNKRSLIRLTADLDNLHLLEEKIKLCKQNNIPFSVNLKHTGSYDIAQIQFVGEYAQVQGAQIFYLVDTTGTMIPTELARIVRQLKRSLSIDLGYHGHDSLGFASANSLTAIEEGCKYIDVSLCGIGAGGGNAITETFSLLAKGENCDWNKLIEAGKLLNISQEYQKLQERIFWGFIGCNSAIKNDLINSGPIEKKAKTAMNWKYGEIISKGEYTTLRRLNRAEPEVVKIATEGGIEKLVNEIEFLRRNKSKFHYNFFPDIYSHQITKLYACYEMPFLDGPLYRDYIYTNPDFSLCSRYIKKTVTSLNTLHKEHGTIDASEFSNKFYFERLAKRWHGLLRSASKPPKAFDPTLGLVPSNVEYIFSLIARGTTLTIDGKSFDFSFQYLLDSLKRFPYLLEVPQSSVRLIHGDPHGGNILLHDQEIVFLDPSGFLDGGDIAYDFGKLLITYDWHDLSMMHMLEPPEVVLTPMGLEITNNRVYKDNRIANRHEVLRKEILSLLKADVLPLYENDDPLILQRIRLLLYLHQFSFTPTLIKERPQAALHVLLNAVSDYMNLLKEDGFGLLN